MLLTFILHVFKLNVGHNSKNYDVFVLVLAEPTLSGSYSDVSVNTCKALIGYRRVVLGYILVLLSISYNMVFTCFFYSILGVNPPKIGKKCQ